MPIKPHFKSYFIGKAHGIVYIRDHFNKNILTVLKFTEHYLEKLNENCKMEQLPINVCFETLLFPSNPTCSNFQFSIDSSSGFAFSVLSAL